MHRNLPSDHHKHKCRSRPYSPRKHTHRSTKMSHPAASSTNEFRPYWCISPKHKHEHVKFWNDDRHSYRAAPESHSGGGHLGTPEDDSYQPSPFVKHKFECYPRPPPVPKKEISDDYPAYKCLASVKDLDEDLQADTESYTPVWCRNEDGEKGGTPGRLDGRS
eukprot:734829_1